MASFYKRGGYQWEARIRRRGFPTIGRTFKSKSEAQIWAIQTEAEMQRGSFICRNPAEDLSMRDLIERFTIEVSPSHKGHLKEVARMRHTAKCRVWEAHVSKLKLADIAAWRDQQLKAVAPSTVLREMGDLALVLNHSMKEWGIVLPSNPFKNVKLLMSQTN